MRILIVLVLCLAMMTPAEARRLSFHWDVKSGTDVGKKLVITINNMTPGPTIRAQQGDTIVVEVANRLAKESLAITWPGIRQIGTPSCEAGKTCIYQFIVDQAGKHLYQSKLPMQKEAGLYGQIVVYP